MKRILQNLYLITAILLVIWSRLTFRCLANGNRVLALRDMLYEAFHFIISQREVQTFAILTHAAKSRFSFKKRLPSDLHNPNTWRNRSFVESLS